MKQRSGMAEEEKEPKVQSKQNMFQNLLYRQTKLLRVFRFDRIDDDVEIDDFGIVTKEYVPVLEQNIKDDESDMEEELSDYVSPFLSLLSRPGRREELLHLQDLPGRALHRHPPRIHRLQRTHRLSLASQHHQAIEAQRRHLLARIPRTTRLPSVPSAAGRQLCCHARQ